MSFLSPPPLVSSSSKPHLIYHHCISLCEEQKVLNECSFTWSKNYWMSSTWYNVFLEYYLHENICSFLWNLLCLGKRMPILLTIYLYLVGSSEIRQTYMKTWDLLHWSREWDGSLKATMYSLSHLYSCPVRKC